MSGHTAVPQMLRRPVTRPAAAAAKALAVIASVFWCCSGCHGLSKGVSFVAQSTDQVLRSNRLRSHLALRATAGELDAMKLAELKEICRSQSLPVSGRKADLIARILAEESGVAEEDERGEEEEEEEEEDIETASEPPSTPKRRSSAPSGYIESTDISGPPGKPIISGDTIYFLARTGKYLEYPEHREDPRARAEIKGPRQALVIQKSGGGAIQSGDTVTLKCHLGVYLDFVGTAVRARYTEVGDWQKIRITSEAGSGPIRTGDIVFLRGHQDNVLDVEKENVKCRWPDEGRWQRLAVEK
eukprot:s1218_g23.t1